MKNIYIDFWIKIEGLTVPIKKLSVVSQKNVPCFFDLELMSVPEIKNILYDTIIEVFWRKDKGEYIFMFDANISGKNIQKNGDTYSRILVGMQFVNKVNEVPYRYMDALTSNSIGNYEYMFANMSDSTQKEYKMKDIQKRALGWDEAKNISFNNINANEYFKKFFNATIGDEAWETYYKNIGVRLQIIKDHVLVDSGKFHEFYKGKALLNLLLKTSESVRGGYVLDELMKIYSDVGYTYISPINPVFNENKLDEDKGKLKIASKDLGIAKHILTPHLINCVPPKCNVIFAGDGANVILHINERPITRLLEKYKYNSSWEPIYCSVYPPSLVKGYDSNKNPFKDNKDSDYNLTDEEKIFGVNMQVNEKSYLLNVLTDNELSEATHDGERQRLLNGLTAYNFNRMRYQSNQIKIDIPEYLPYLVCGLPGLLYDPDVGSFYYGEYSYIGYNFNLSEGFCSTSIVMQNAREISDVREICGSKINNKYEWDKINPFVPDFFNPFGNDVIKLDDEFISDISRYYYKKILGGDAKKNGWQSIVDMQKIDSDGEEIACTPDEILNKIEEIYEGGREDSFVERDITTGYQYYASITGNYLAGTDNINQEMNVQYGVINGKIVEIDKLGDDNFDRGTRYVKERREIVADVQEAVSKAVIYES